MKLIAVVGMCGAGKTEFSYILEDRGFFRIRFGDITEDILKEKKMDITEENEKKVRESIRREHGMEAYAKLNLPKIKEALKESNVVIDGLYSWEEYELLKKEIPETIFVCVYSDPEARYERLSVRDDRPLTREQAISRDKKEIENLNKGGPIAMADYTLLNVGTLFDLKNNADKYLEWMHEKK